MLMLYIFLLVAILISVYLTIKTKKNTLYSCTKYNSLPDLQNNTNEKFGSFSIGAALKTPIIYNYGNVDYEGVS